jgi:hypothetical protein
MSSRTESWSQSRFDTQPRDATTSRSIRFTSFGSQAACSFRPSSSVMAPFTVSRRVFASYSSFASAHCGSAARGGAERSARGAGSFEAAK